MEISNLQNKFLPLTAGLIPKAFFVLGSLAISQWFLSDFVNLPGGAFGLLGFGYAIFWFTRPLVPKFDTPTTVNGWVRRCKQVLKQFEALEVTESKRYNVNERASKLNEIIDRDGPQELAFVSSKGVDLPEKELVHSAIAGPNPLKLSWSSSLPINDSSWNWPNVLIEHDLLIYVLPLPLRASDLLWLEKVPVDQPSWVMVALEDSIKWPEQLQELQSQLPQRWENKILRWNKTDSDLNKLLNPVRRVLSRPYKNLDITRQRLLANLHSSWQGDLEYLRRKKFSVIQSRTQWVVAGAVFASPVPSTDLLALSVANGMMIQEMAQIWECPWGSETLQAIAKQMALAAIAQGVVEWSGHALFSVAKLHGSSWLAAGTMQALSAAYLTRVVGRSMADWMALNNGVAKPDLESLKKQAPDIVRNAAKQERLDWTNFLKQANGWIKDKSIQPKLEATCIDAI